MFTLVNPRAEIAKVSSHLDELVAAHQSSRAFTHAEDHSGGIFPMCVDPDTKRSYMLLGLSGAKQYCHFHGRVDEGETHAVGTAREAWEESKGILGPMADIWRAIMMQKEGFSLPFIGTGTIIYFGELSATERQLWSYSFFGLPHYFSCMKEVSRVDWIDACALRDVCLRASHDRSQREDGLFLASVGERHDAAGVNYTVPGFAPGAILRPFLQEWFSHRYGFKYFADPVVAALFNEGNPGPLRSIRELPTLQLSDRDKICKLLSIPVCTVCGGEGHVTGVCASLEARRSGTRQDDQTSKYSRRGDLCFSVTQRSQTAQFTDVCPYVRDCESHECFYFENAVGQQWALWALGETGKNISDSQDAAFWAALTWPVTFQPRMHNQQHFFPQHVAVGSGVNTNTTPPGPEDFPKAVLVTSGGRLMNVELSALDDTKGKKKLLRQGCPGFCKAFLESGSCSKQHKCRLLHLVQQ